MEILSDFFQVLDVMIASTLVDLFWIGFAASL